MKSYYVLDSDLVDFDDYLTVVIRYPYELLDLLILMFDDGINFKKIAEYMKTGNLYHMMCEASDKYKKLDKNIYACKYNNYEKAIKALYDAKYMYQEKEEFILKK